jgi:hypothetical protein
MLGSSVAGDMKQTDWTRLAPRPRDSTDRERIKYLVTFLMHARGSEKTKIKAINELGGLTRFCGRIVEKKASAS